MSHSLSLEVMEMAKWLPCWTGWRPDWRRHPAPRACRLPRPLASCRTPATGPAAEVYREGKRNWSLCKTFSASAHSTPWCTSFKPSSQPLFLWPGQLKWVRGRGWAGAFWPAPGALWMEPCSIILLSPFLAPCLPTLWDAVLTRSFLVDGHLWEICNTVRINETSVTRTQMRFWARKPLSQLVSALGPPLCQYPGGQVCPKLEAERAAWRFPGGLGLREGWVLGQNIWDPHTGEWKTSAKYFAVSDRAAHP